MPPPAPPRLFDRARLQARRDRVAAGFADYAFLHQRVSSDIESRLDDTTRQFASGLELGAAGGALSARLTTRGRAIAMLAADLSGAFCAAAAAKGLPVEQVDEETLPFPPAKFDLVVAPLGLHWINDLPGALVQVSRVLQPDGLFLGALFGAGTLAELRSCLTDAEIELTGGLSPRLSPLPSLQDMAGLMQRAGFALPVADRDRVTVRYGDLAALLRDLKGMGERSCFAPGLTRPLPRRVLARTASLYAERFSGTDGRISASFEILHVSGWAPGPGQPQPLKPGSATASLEAAVRGGRPLDDPA